MTWQIKACLSLALAALVGFGLWYLHRDGYEAGKNEVQVQWDADKIKRDEAQRDALIAYADKLKQAEVQHDQDQAVIDKLHDDAGRVRIHLPTCSTANSGPGEDGKAGVLSARVDAVFADFQDRVGGIIRRCDQLNIDAIRENGER